MGEKTLRWPRVALLLSLAVNLLVIGVVAGLWLSHDGPDRGTRAASLRDLGNVPFMMALAPDDRAALVSGLRDSGHDRAFRENRERLRTRFEAVLALLRAPDFDPEALRNLLAEQRAALVERQQLGEDLLIERLTAMGNVARAAYADRLDRSLHRGPRRTSRP